MIDEEAYESLMESEDAKDCWKIANGDLANWAVRKIKEEEADTERLITIAKNEISRYSEKIMELEARLENRTGFLKGKLREYFESISEGKKETKTQVSYELLDGKLVYKKPQYKMIPDKEKLIALCEANNMPEFIKTKKEFDWAAYKKECEIIDGNVVNTQTGDILDCIEIEEEDARFDVK